MDYDNVRYVGSRPGDIMNEVFFFVMKRSPGLKPAFVTIVWQRTTRLTVTADYYSSGDL